MDSVAIREEQNTTSRYNMQQIVAPPDIACERIYTAPFEAMCIREDWLPVPVHQQSLSQYYAWHRDQCMASFRSWGLDNIRPVGNPSPLLERPIVIPGPRTDFVMFPAALDPLFVQGAFPIPKRNQAELHKALSVFDFPAIYIVHEIPKGSWKGDIMPYIVPPPPQATVRLSESLGRVASGLLEIPKLPLTLGRYAGPVILGLAVLPLGIMAGAAGATGLLLDPLVLGTVNVPQTNLWQYFILTGWRW
jgi:hypothetical protein